MVSIPVVIATTFMEVCGTGRNVPCRFSCVDSNNLSVDYIVKAYNSIGSRIVCEFTASILARMLTLNTPEIAIVHTDPRLLNFVPDLKAREYFKAHPGPHFGSQDLGPGMTVMNSGYSLRGKALEQAIDIFAFDMLIQNVDRSASSEAGKPNVLFKGDDLFIIDHELAFSFVDLLGQPPPPWQLRNNGLAERHLFYARLKSYANTHQLSFDRFTEKLGTLPVTCIQDVMQMLPAEWYSERYASKISLHFEQVLKNVEKFHYGLLEVFA